MNLRNFSYTVFLIFLFSIVFSSGLALGQQENFEIKKAKKINSDEICGIDFCDKLDNNREIQSPSFQLKNGISLDMIKCKQNLELIVKKTNFSPACVKTSSVTKLIELGWGIKYAPKSKNLESIQTQEILPKNKINEKLDFSILTVQQESMDEYEVILNVRSSEISGQKSLIFSGINPAVIIASPPP